MTRTVIVGRVEQEDEGFLTARVSQDCKVIGIDHPTNADFEAVYAAHVALRDRLSERIADRGLCPFNPTPRYPAAAYVDTPRRLPR